MPMNRLALALLLLASLTAPAWPGLHAALHAHESDAVAHADASDHVHDAHTHDAAVHLGIASDPAHGHEHPELASVVTTRSAPPVVAPAMPAADLDLIGAEPIRLTAPDESPPFRACVERGAPDRPRGPPSV